jgi:hypothetical protein
LRKEGAGEVVDQAEDFIRFSFAAGFDFRLHAAP